MIPTSMIESLPILTKAYRQGDTSDIEQSAVAFVKRGVAIERRLGIDGLQ